MPDPNPTPAPKPSLHLNWEEWLPYLNDPSLTDDQKREMITALWSIVLAFVDLGWGLGDGEKTSGQSFDLTAALRAAVVNSNECQLSRRSEAVGQTPQPKEEV